MKELLDFAIRAAREAGEATLAYFGTEDIGLETKDNGTPVTLADREAEEILRRVISERFPDDAILGEEFGEERAGAPRRWIVDPVDGTKSFARNVPLFGTLVGLEENGEAVLGVAYLPALGEMVYAARGHGAWWITGIGWVETMRPARVSSVGDPADALLCTTSVGGFESSGHAALYERLRAHVGRDRGWGDCYGHVLVATGRADVMVDPALSIWDCAALLPIVEEAGGSFTDLAGNPTHDGGSGISTNGLLHEGVLGLVTAR